MTQELIDDLKQFIAGTIRQELTDIRHDVAELATDVSTSTVDLATLRSDMHDRFEDQYLAVHTMMDALYGMHEDHEGRITLLGRQA